MGPILSTSISFVLICDNAITLNLFKNMHAVNTIPTEILKVYLDLYRGAVYKTKPEERVKIQASPHQFSLYCELMVYFTKPVCN